VTSTHGNKCGQFFATDFGFNKFVPMASKSEAGYALQEVIREIGIPNQIHTDGAKELTQGRWRDICRDANILTTQTVIEVNCTQSRIQSISYNKAYIVQTI